jgi:hypothetical protein
MKTKMLWFSALVLALSLGWAPGVSATTAFIQVSSPNIYWGLFGWGYDRVEVSTWGSGEGSFTPTTSGAFHLEGTGLLTVSCSSNTRGYFSDPVPGTGGDEIVEIPLGFSASLFATLSLEQSETDQLRFSSLNWNVNTTFANFAAVPDLVSPGSDLSQAVGSYDATYPAGYLDVGTLSYTIHWNSWVTEVEMFYEHSYFPAGTSLMYPDSMSPGSFDIPFTWSMDGDVVQLPLPGSFMLLGSGLGGLIMYGRRKLSATIRKI